MQEESELESDFESLALSDWAGKHSVEALVKGWSESEEDEGTSVNGGSGMDQVPSTNGSVEGTSLLEVAKTADEAVDNYDKNLHAEVVISEIGEDSPAYCNLGREPSEDIGPIIGLVGDEEIGLNKGGTNFPIDAGLAQSPVFNGNTTNLGDRSSLMPNSVSNVGENSLVLLRRNERDKVEIDSEHTKMKTALDHDPNSWKNFIAQMASSAEKVAIEKNHRGGKRAAKKGKETVCAKPLEMDEIEFGKKLGIIFLEEDKLGKSVCAERLRHDRLGGTSGVSK